MSRSVMRALFVSFVDQVPQRLRSTMVGDASRKPLDRSLERRLSFLRSMCQSRIKEFSQLSFSFYLCLLHRKAMHPLRLTP